MRKLIDPALAQHTEGNNRDAVFTLFETLGYADGTDPFDELERGARNAFFDASSELMASKTLANLRELFKTDEDLAKEMGRKTGSSIAHCAKNGSLSALWPRIVLLYPDEIYDDREMMCLVGWRAGLSFVGEQCFARTQCSIEEAVAVLGLIGCPEWESAQTSHDPQEAVVLARRLERNVPAAFSSQKPFGLKGQQLALALQHTWQAWGVSAHLAFRLLLDDISAICASGGKEKP